MTAHRLQDVLRSCFSVGYLRPRFAWCPLSLLLGLPLKSSTHYAPPFRDSRLSQTFAQDWYSRLPDFFWRRDILIVQSRCGPHPLGFWGLFSHPPPQRQRKGDETPHPLHSVAKRLRPGFPLLAVCHHTTTHPRVRPYADQYRMALLLLSRPTADFAKRGGGVCFISVGYLARIQETVYLGSTL